MKREGLCAIPNCRNHATTTYYGRVICDDHIALTADQIKIALNIPIDRGPAKGPEAAVQHTGPTETGTMHAENANAGATTPQEEAVKTKKAKKGSTKQTDEKKAKAPREKKAPRTDLRTIATRVPQATFTLLHDAASAREMKLGPWMESTLEAAARKILT